jgi:hypothetical protein
MPQKIGERPYAIQVARNVQGSVTLGVKVVALDDNDAIGERRVPAEFFQELLSERRLERRKLKVTARVTRQNELHTGGA